MERLYVLAPTKTDRTLGAPLFYFLKNKLYVCENSGAIFIGPALSLERISKKGVNAYIKPVASLISSVFPAAPIVATSKNKIFPEMQMAWDLDPLTWYGFGSTQHNISRLSDRAG